MSQGDYRIYGNTHIGGVSKYAQISASVEKSKILHMKSWLVPNSCDISLKMKYRVNCLCIFDLSS